MGTRFPVGVRIKDGVSDQHVTASVSGLKWRRVAPGGFHSASMTLHLDPSVFSDLGPADRLWIYGPDGRTLWEGFLDNPGRVAGNGGVGLDLSAMGTTVLASDRAQALPYLNRDLSEWEQTKAATLAASAAGSASDDPTATAGGDSPQGLLCQFNPGAPVDAGAVAQMGYSALADAGMMVGVARYTVKSGKVDASYRSDLAYSSGVGSTGLIAGGTITTGSATVVRYGGTGGTIPAGNDRVFVQLRRSGAATNVTDDVTWSWFGEVSVAALRVNTAGTPLTAAEMQAQGGGVSVRADYIVADLVGRMLDVVDPNRATIDAASFAIDQFSYTDAATAADVLDDLALYEPDMFWEMLHSTAGGYVFNYRAWPTTARYEVSTRDGYDAPGSDFDLCNRIAVKWTDEKGKDRVTVVTAASAAGTLVAGVAATVVSSSLKALEDVGRVRDAEPITLPEGRGSEANAQRAGEQALAAKADPPKAATVTVRRPVVDLLRGGTAMPYEIEPGYLVRVRETGDLLRLTEVEVDDEAGVAVLTLGEPVLTEEQRVARLERVARRTAA